MFADPQFWVAVSFILFLAAIFNPVRKILVSSLDAQISEIKLKIDEAEKLKNDAQKTLNELKLREVEVEKEIEKLRSNSVKKINDLQEISSKKLSEQIEKRKILAENKIDLLIRDANLSIKNYISNSAIEATTKILINKLTTDKDTELIKKSINELKIVLKN